MERHSRFPSAGLCRWGRRGLSLLEVLVALSVIALLVAILLPAVQSAREISRRTQCVNHLRQIGTALQSFESTHRRFPARELKSKGLKSGFPPKSHSLHMQLLPFVDQQSVYNKIDFDKPGPESSVISRLPKVAHTQIPVFKCPSNGWLQGISYRGCTGYSPDIFDRGSWSGGQGAFVDFDGLEVRDFRDGLSRTVAFSEKIPSDNNPAFGTGDFWYTGVTDLVGRGRTAEEEISILVKTCGSLTGSPAYYHANAGRTWYLPDYGFVLYNHALAPNSKISDCAGDFLKKVASDYTLGPKIGLFTATSYHSGGVNVLFCDGHTEFVSDNVDLHVWRDLSTRSSLPDLTPY